MLRAQQTALGVVTYSLMSILLWPSSSRDTFKSTVCSVVDAQPRLFLHYMSLATGKSNDDAGAARLRSQTTRALGGLDTLLDGAMLESYDIWEMRRIWRQLFHQLSALGHTLARCRLSLLEIKEMQFQHLLDGLPALGAEIDARFRALESLLAGREPGQYPTETKLRLDEVKFNTLSHFHRAALLLTFNRLNRLERLTRAMVKDAEAILRSSNVGVRMRADTGSDMPAAIDPDRLA